MTTIRRKQLRSQSGIALLTTILLMLLMASMLVGFIILINSGQQVSGMNNDYSKAFYAAEAGMEQLTAGLGTLFDSTYSPSGAQISAITSTPPTLSGVSYVRFDGSSGYTISYPVDANGNPAATNTTIKSGPYQGMTALATSYTLNVTARTAAGSEVKLQRTTQTVGIPMFQFGIFSDMDLSFFPGPSLEFGGRTHTNGNLFLAANSGPVYMDDRVTAPMGIRTRAQVMADRFTSPTRRAHLSGQTVTPTATYHSGLTKAAWWVCPDPPRMAVGAPSRPLITAICAIKARGLPR